MTQDEKDHKAALASLGCMLCWRLFGFSDAEVELHHRREGGWGKGDYKTLIPLCYPHHRGDQGVHGLGTKAFVLVYGVTQQQLLDDALSRLEKQRGNSVMEMAAEAGRRRAAVLDCGGGYVAIVHETMGNNPTGEP